MSKTIVQIYVCLMIKCYRKFSAFVTKTTVFSWDFISKIGLNYSADHLEWSDRTEIGSACAPRSV